MADQFDPIDVLNRLAALEDFTNNLPLDALPLGPLQAKLENDWQPDAAVLIQPKSITSDQLGNNTIDAPETLHVVRGIVNANGSLAAGSGFTSTRTSLGHYTVTFPAGTFKSEPAVTLAVYNTVAAAATNMISLDANTTKTATQFIVYVTNPGSTAFEDHKWEFVAVGPRS